MNDGRYSEEYIEPPPKTETKKETHVVGVATHSAPAHPVRVLRSPAGGTVKVDEIEKLRAKIRLYSNSIIFLTGLIVGFVFGVLIL